MLLVMGYNYSINYLYLKLKRQIRIIDVTTKSTIHIIIVFNALIKYTNAEHKSKTKTEKTRVIVPEIPIILLAVPLSMFPLSYAGNFNA